MEPKKLIQTVKIASVVIAAAALLYMIVAGQILLGAVMAAGIVLLGAAIIHMYRTDYLGELND